MRPITNPERTFTLNIVFEKTTQKIVPGPDAYKFSQALDKNGTYYASKFRSSGSKVWNPPSSQRFNKSSTSVPAPNNYFPVNEMSDSGKYVLSSHKGHGKRKLDKEFRESFVNIPAKITKSNKCLM